MWYLVLVFLVASNGQLEDRRHAIEVSSEKECLALQHQSGYVSSAINDRTAGIYVGSYCEASI